MAKKSGYSKIQFFYMSKYKAINPRRADKMARVYKKHGKVEYVNPNETWKDAYHANRVKLALMILLYVYSNDDEKVSRKELKHIKKLNKEEEGYLTKDDQKEIYNLALRKMTLSSFLEYIEQQEYQESIFNDACDRAKKSMIRNRVYDKLLDELKEEFKRYAN